MKTSVVNKRDSEYDIYIGRGSKWGNPFPLIEQTLEERIRVCELYVRYLYESGLINDISELRGKVLGCYCKPNLCHGDYLAKLANEEYDTLLKGEIKKEGTYNE